MAEMGARAAGGPGKKRGGVLVFLVGVLIGALGAVFAPRYLGDYLPGSIGGQSANVTGVVTRKLAEDTRLLLTVVTDSGAVLAAFKERTTEIDLLVEEGDSVTFALAAYAPFVDDPRLGRVVKPVHDPGTSASRGPAADDQQAGTEMAGQADTLGRDTSGQVPGDITEENGAEAPDSGSGPGGAGDAGPVPDGR